MIVNNRADIRRSILLGLSLSLLLAGLFLGLAQAAPPAQAPDTPPSVAGGRALWLENCQPCHGPTGRGDGPTAQSIPNPLPDFADPQTARQLVPTQNFDIIKNGRMETMMPPWGNRLTDEQIWDAAAYVWWLGASSQNLADGETLYQEQCQACHGEDGAGTGPEAPPGLIDFSNLQTMMERSQAGLWANFSAADEHAPFADLSDEALWPTLDYIRTFSFAVPERNGLLKGQVINATTNQPQGSVEVKLYAFEGETLVETLTTQADAEGRYTFKNLSTEHTIQYLVESLYQNIVYLSDQPGVFVPDSNEAVLNLNVYETTADPAAIELIRLNYMLAITPDRIQAAQVFMFSNNGNQTYTGQNGVTFAFTLPQAAENITFEDALGDRFIPRNGGYTDTAPIIPGQNSHTVIALYDIPYDGDSLTVDVPIPANIPAVNVILQDAGASLSSDRLRFLETREGHGDKFSIFSGTDLSEGETLTLELADLDQVEIGQGFSPAGSAAGGPPVDQNLLRWMVIGLGALVIIAVTLIYPLSRSQPAAQPNVVLPQPEDTNRRWQKLLLLLARLDDLFESGELDEQTYRQARARYKTELARLLSSQN